MFLESSWNDSLVGVFCLFVCLLGEGVASRGRNGLRCKTGLAGGGGARL